MPSSTRKRKNQTPAFTGNTTAVTSDDLPPSRPRKEPLRKVSPPLSSLSLNNLIYILALIAVLFVAFYSYRIMQHTSQVGDWWNLGLGGRQPQLQPEAGGEKSYSPMLGKNRRRRKSASASDVEDKINALAEALGMPSKELAAAIAGAVKEYVPPASLSSVAAKETGRSSEAMKVLLGKENEELASGFGLKSVVGIEEPLEQYDA